MMIQGRKNRLAKKRVLDDIHTAVARSEYKAMQTGNQVDPRLLAQQEQAQRETDEAKAAMAPLVEQARDAGMSPRTIDLYIQSSSGY